MGAPSLVGGFVFWRFAPNTGLRRPANPSRVCVRAYAHNCSFAGFNRSYDTPPTPPRSPSPWSAYSLDTAFVTPLQAAQAALERPRHFGMLPAKYPVGGKQV